MTDLEAAAVLILWQSGRFDTLDIARALKLDEHDVCNVLYAIKRVEHGEPLWTPEVIENQQVPA